MKAVANPQGIAARHLQKTLRNEELAGLKLATIVRLVALAATAVSFFILQSDEIKYVNIGILAVFAVIGVANYRVATIYGRQGWFNFAFFALDVALLTLALLVLNPSLHDDALPPAMMLRSGNFVFYYLFVALAALSYSPLLMVWAGFSSALAWGIGTLYVVSLPTTITLGKYPLPEGGWTNAAVFELLGNPNFVNPFLWQGEVISIAIVAGILAVVVWRSRNLVFRQSVIARERANLSRYFPPNLVDKFAESDSAFTDVRRQPVTVLFADIVGFTRLAEKMEPESVVALLREFHSVLENSVFEHGGTLNKYLGDGIMATFGTPEPGSRDPADALACARAMLTAIERWNIERRKKGNEPITLSVGLHCGDAVLGDIGSERQLEFAVIGDVVNVASRIEALTRELKVSLLVSNAVIQAASQIEKASDGLSDFQRMPDQRLRGRSQPITLWRLATNTPG